MYLIHTNNVMHAGTLKRLDRGGDSMKKIKKPCKCNKPYDFTATGYTLCLKCGCQYPTPIVDEEE